ncbi:MAG: SDR family oxidoreductase [Verrucomicrobiota bacterium]|nr:SDR family oxidoreductase [Verrucomicrobiota bacterium]
MSTTAIIWDTSPATPLLLPDLAGKRALVTGATLGIGRATIELLLQNGVECYGLARHLPEYSHPKLHPILCDLSTQEGVAHAIDTIGGMTTSLDFVVNVAGIDPKYKIDAMTVGQWDRLMDLNLRAYYFIIQGCLPWLRVGTGKSIVNVSSINYRLGVPGRAAYSASKAGILGLTTGLARELGREGIRINTVTPGWTFTERQIEEYFSGEKKEDYLDFLADRQSIALQMQALDIANHIVFYLSRVSRASTGHNSVVDVGWILE